VLASEGVTAEGLQATQEPLCPYAYEYKLQEESEERKKTVVAGGFRVEMLRTTQPIGIRCSQ